MSEISYFVNYSDLYRDRTIEVKLMPTLKAAKEFLTGRHGYIVRSERNRAAVVWASPGFKPSAGEEQKIINLTGEKWPMRPAFVRAVRSKRLPGGYAYVSMRGKQVHKVSWTATYDSPEACERWAINQCVSYCEINNLVPMVDLT